MFVLTCVPILKPLGTNCDIEGQGQGHMCMLLNPLVVMS